MHHSKAMPFTEGVGQEALGFAYKSLICKQNLAKLVQIFDL